MGLYSCLAASRGKRVVAVEPLASNLKVLVDNLYRNGFTEAEVYLLGLVNSPGVARLYRWRNRRFVPALDGRVPRNTGTALSP